MAHSTVYWPKYKYKRGVLSADQWLETTISKISLLPRQVHVWRVPLEVADDTLEQYTSWLSADELSRANRFHATHHTRAFIVARGTLRTLLGGYLGLHPRLVQFHYTELQKPYILHLLGASELCFNLSHSDQLALVALSRDCRVGVDVEKIRPIENLERIAEQFFSAEEAESLRQQPPLERSLAFLRCWTRKEAYIKAIGSGLSHPLSQFTVSLAPHHPPQLIRSELYPTAPQRWQLFHLMPSLHYLGAMAIESPRFTPQYFHFNHSSSIR